MQANPHGKPAPTKSQVPGGGTRTRNGLGKSHRGFSWTCQREEKIPDHIIPVWSGRDHPPFHPSKCHSAGDNDHGSSRESSTPGSRSLAQLMEVVAPREGHRRAVTAHLAPPSTLCSFMGSNTQRWLLGIILGSSWDPPGISGNLPQQAGGLGSCHGTASTCHDAATGTCGGTARPQPHAQDAAASPPSTSSLSGIWDNPTTGQLQNSSLGASPALEVPSKTTPKTPAVPRRGAQRGQGCGSAVPPVRIPGKEGETAIQG